MYLPHPGSTALLQSPWSGECKITCECSCLAMLITAIYFCLGLQKLTSPSSNVFWTVWLVRSQSHHHLLVVPLLRSLHWLPVKYCPFQDLLADLQGSSWGTTCLPSLLDCHFSSITFTEIKQRNHSVLRIRTNTGARAFSSCAPSLWNNLPLSVHSATFRRRLKTYLFDLASPPPPRRHRCAQRPVDVTERLQWLCIWTPFCLLRH